MFNEKYSLKVESLNYFCQVNIFNHWLILKTLYFPWKVGAYLYRPPLSLKSGGGGDVYPPRILYASAFIK